MRPASFLRALLALALTATTAAMSQKSGAMGSAPSKEASYQNMAQLWAHFQFQRVDEIESHAHVMYEQQTLLKLQKEQAEQLLNCINKTAAGYELLTAYFERKFKGADPSSIFIPCYVEAATIDERPWWVVAFYVASPHYNRPQPLKIFRIEAIGITTSRVVPCPWAMPILAAEEYTSNPTGTQVYESANYRIKATPINAGTPPEAVSDRWYVEVIRKSDGAVIYRRHEWAGGFCYLLYNQQQTMLLELPYKGHTFLAYSFSYDYPVGYHESLRALLCENTGMQITPLETREFGYGPLALHDHFLAYCEGLQNLAGYGEEPELCVSGGVLDIDRDCQVTALYPLTRELDRQGFLLGNFRSIKTNAAETQRREYLKSISSALDSLAIRVAAAKSKQADACSTVYPELAK